MIVFILKILFYLTVNTLCYLQYRCSVDWLSFLFLQLLLNGMFLALMSRIGNLMHDVGHLYEKETQIYLSKDIFDDYENDLYTDYTENLTIESGYKLLECRCINKFDFRGQNYTQEQLSNLVALAWKAAHE